MSGGEGKRERESVCESVVGEGEGEVVKSMYHCE